MPQRSTETRTSAIRPPRFSRLLGAAGLGLTLLSTACSAQEAPAPQPARQLVEVGAPDPRLLVLDSNPAKSAVAKHPALQPLADQPTAHWVNDTSRESMVRLRGTVQQAKAEKKIPVLVLNIIPNRDCNGASKGGAKDTAEYKKSIDAVAGIIGQSKAITIVEPNALMHIDDPACPDIVRSERLGQLQYAGKTLNTKANDIYIDAGHPGWKSAPVTGDLLEQVDVRKTADGAAFNTSNFHPTDKVNEYADKVATYLGYPLEYVVDTSQNGNPDFNNQWCEPPDRQVGQAPTLDTGVTNADAYLWINFAGSSSGCNGGEPAGTWNPDRALDMLTK